MARLRPFLLPLLVFALLALAPVAGFGQGYMLNLLARAMILALGAVWLSVLVGGGGLVSLGHAAFLGIGAYAVVILDHARIVDATVVVPVAMLAGAAFALVTGAVSLRTSGVNFIMITLAFGQMAFYTASSLAAYGGDDGYTLYGRTQVLGARLLQDRYAFHYVVLGLLILGWYAAVRLLASRFGRVLRAAHDNALRAQAVGFNPYPYRLVAYTLAGAVTALAGVLLANATEFVAPSYTTWQRSGDLLFMVILGGLGQVHGAILGALAFVLLEEWLGHITPHWRLVFGPFLILAVLFLKGGIAGQLDRLIEARGR